MSLIGHASKLLHSISKVQQSAQISTTPTILTSCPKKKCPVIKGVGCAPRARFDCEPAQRRRCKCIRIDVPEPCFSECLRCPPPPTRLTECPDCSFKALKPPPQCIKKKLGITIDGCNPRESVKMLGSCRPRNVACKKANKPCEYVDPNIPACDPCLEPFQSYEPCAPAPVRAPPKQACYAPNQDCGHDQPRCSSCQEKPSCKPKKTKSTCPVMLSEKNCIDPDANCIDPTPPCGGPDPACQMEEPCRTREISTCCSPMVCDFRSEPRKRDAALNTCRSCEDFSSPPNCPTCGNPSPPKCPICGGPIEDCEKKSSIVDTLWNIIKGKNE